MGIIFNETFTDTLLKLGNKLMLKSQLLAEERDHTKTLVTDISHQLKTPVSALKNCLALSMEANSPQERDIFLERCVLQLSKLESLMEALINISRLETSMITLRKEKPSYRIFSLTPSTRYISRPCRKISLWK